MWDRVVREQAQQRQQAWASAQKPRLTAEQRAMVRAAVDSSVQRLYPGPTPRSQQAPPASALKRQDDQARWAQFIQRVEQDEEMRRVHRQIALEERSKQLRPQSVGVTLKEARCSSMRQERTLFAAAVSPRPPATSRSSDRRRVCRGSEVANQPTAQSATHQHATPRSQSARHGSSGTSRKPRATEHHGTPRAQSARHWSSRTSRDMFVPPHFPVRPILPPPPCIESGEALAAEIFAKIERHIKQCATPGKHSYLITPRREVAMTRQLVGEVDILATLPEAARFKIAARMKTMYRVQPGQVIIQKGAVGREMYFIINGTAEVLIDDLDGKPVAQLRKGSFFGEMALLREEVRSAYVRAVTEMDLFFLAKPDLRAVIDEEPDLEEVLVAAMQARQSRDTV